MSAAQVLSRSSGLQRLQAPLLATVALAALLSVPALLSGYFLLMATQVLVYAIALLGLNLLTGASGQISLGHGAFFAIGAYTVPIAMTQAALSYWAAVPLAGAVCFVVGFLFGRPALRLEGLYLALATFALAIALPQLLKHRSLGTWTGGVQGLFVDKLEAPRWLAGSLPLSGDQWLYVFALLCGAPLFLAARNLLRGRTGLALMAIREQPTAAAAMGIDLARYKSLAFAVSAMVTGVAGALGALTAQFVSPDSFGFFLSITLLVGLVIGGVGSTFGVFFGAAFVVFVPNVAEHLSKSVPWAIYGVLLMLFVYLMPQGVSGLVRQTVDHAARRLLSRRAP